MKFSYTVVASTDTVTLLQIFSSANYSNIFMQPNKMKSVDYTFPTLTTISKITKLTYCTVAQFTTNIITKTRP